MKTRKWYKSMITAVISFAMIIGIFGGMKLEAKAASASYTLFLNDNESKYDICHNKKFAPGDILTIDKTGTTCSTLRYYFQMESGGEYVAKGDNSMFMSSTTQEITIPNFPNNDTTLKWYCNQLTVTQETVLLTFLPVEYSSSDPSDTPSSETGSESAPSTPSHECNFQWVTTVEPQPGVDGLEEYKCVTCGAVKESRSIPANMATVKNLYGFIKDAPENETVTTDFGTLHTISDYLLKKMAERSDATVTIQFEYKNQKLQITFPAGTDYTPVLNDTDTMYGFYGVAAKLGLTVTERQ